MVIMRRSSDSTSFDRLYAEYEDGFGNITSDFWYGLRAMEALTSRDSYEMRLDIYENVNDTESSGFAHYDHFAVRGQNHTLELGKFYGSDSDFMDNLRQFDRQHFSARRHMHDEVYCPIQLKGGWWYAHSERCNQKPDQTPGTVLTSPYDELKWHDTSIQESPSARRIRRFEMKIRPKNCLNLT